MDDRKADAPVVAPDFVGTRIYSGENGVDWPKELGQLVAANPYVRYHNRERGYVRCTVTPKTWTSDYVAVDEVTKEGGKCEVRASFVVEAGTPGVKKA